MEFVVATFPTVRGVRMDGAPQGQTGELIGVQRGHHLFDLGTPRDYLPASLPALVIGTSQAQPMVLAFQPMVRAIRPAPVATARAAQPKPKKKPGAKTVKRPSADRTKQRAKAAAGKKAGAKKGRAKKT